MTFLRWHRQAYRLFWRGKSRPGRPSIPAELPALIRQMAHDNSTWGQERIANELLLKLGLRVSIPTDHDYRFLMHDRDSIFSQPLNQQVRHLGLRILKTPARSSQANALCERLLGTLRRECVDFMIPPDGTPRARHLNRMGP